MLIIINLNIRIYSNIGTIKMGLKFMYILKYLK